MKSIMLNEIDEEQFYEDGLMKLPAGLRTYLDGTSAEYQLLGMEQKIVHFAYLLQRKYPLYQRIKSDIDERVQEPQNANFEYTCKVGLTRMLDYLSFDEVKSSAIILVRFMPFDAVFDILKEQLLLSYIEFSTPQNKLRYELKKLNCNYLDILKHYVGKNGLKEQI